MPVDNFDQWFANYLGQDAHEVTRLLGDKTAIHFLIAWSIFESYCFGGFAKVEKFEAFVRDSLSTKGFKPSKLMDAANHFHNRYQDKELYDNLMWEQKSPKLNSILSKYFEALSADEIVYFVIFVVYRYRNNIFHGNKGVGSWLNFNDQIELCIKIMQTLITFVVEVLHKAAEQGDADAQEALSKLSIDRKK